MAILRNTESHFAQTPTVNIRRSRFKRPFTHKTTFNAGKLVPLMVDEVLPGDTYSIDTSMVIRMSTPIHPVMDNAYFDYYFFFVPNRLVWDDWQEFMGENPNGPWTTDSRTLTVPKVNFGIAAPKALLLTIWVYLSIEQEFQPIFYHLELMRLSGTIGSEVKTLSNLL